MAVKRTTKYPDYEPEFDKDGNMIAKYALDEKLYAERFCACGGILRIRAEFRDIAPIVANFEVGHTGPGHEPVDKLTCIKAREELRRRGFEQAQARGVIPEDEEYEPGDWSSKNIGVTNKEVYG